MRLTYVTGVSGSGKTSLHDLLRARGLEPYELDDGGTPNAAHSQWLQWRAEEHLHAATEALIAEAATDELGADVPPGGVGNGDRIVTGIVLPFSLIDTPTFTRATEHRVRVRFMLLDRPWDDIEATMRDRLADWDPDDVNEQLVINRIQHRRMIRQFDALYGAVDPLVVRVDGGDLDHAMRLLTTDGFR